MTKIYGKVRRGSRRPYIMIPDQTGRKAVLYQDEVIWNGVDDHWLSRVHDVWGALIWANMLLRSRWQLALTAGDNQ